ncbi:hypothetical protein [Bradyrhizobium sp. 2TAF24]|uniref:hypothetical protein n=1 Tax=Bradyrhizobium sp. 2TAF24 TaxID=3233011 RepID=UPI003F923C41
MTLDKGWLRAAVIFACACNVASVAGIKYERYLWAVQSHEAFSENFSDAISDGIYLLPIIVVLLARRNAPIVLAYASVLFVILLGRIYYLLPPSLTGVDGLALKLDWSHLAQGLVGMISGFGMAVLASILLLISGYNAFWRFWEDR